MERETWLRLEADFDGQHAVLVAGSASRSLIEETIGRLGGPLIPDYVEFVTRYGGAIVGSDPVFCVGTAEAMGIEDTLEAQTLRFRADGWPGVEQGLVVSADGRGNPIVLGPDGHLRSYDHDVGDTRVIATSFERFLLQLLDEPAGG